MASHSGKKCISNHQGLGQANGAINNACNDIMRFIYSCYLKDSTPPLPPPPPQMYVSMLIFPIRIVFHIKIPIKTVSSRPCHPSGGTRYKTTEMLPQISAELLDHGSGEGSNGGERTKLVNTRTTSSMDTSYHSQQKNYECKKFQILRWI